MEPAAINQEESAELARAERDRCRQKHAVGFSPGKSRLDVG